MPGIGVELNQQSFSSNGMKLCFDSNLYERLLDYLVPPETVNGRYPQVNLEACQNWNNSRSNWGPEDMYTYSSRDHSIGVTCTSSAWRSNEALLWATRCWAADVTGEARTWRRQRRMLGLGCLAGAVVGAGGLVAAALSQQEGMVVGSGLTVAVAAAGAITHRQLFDPESQAISNFVKAPATSNRFGGIISYELVFGARRTGFTR